MNDEDARFLDNKRIEGTLAEMLADALSFSMRNMKVATIIDKNTGKRNDKTEYPIQAIREAVLNALIHRDYSHYTEGTPIQMIFFADRLEIHSPGSLYGRMTVDQLGYSKPDLRNPALAFIAESQMEAENRYSGIPTIRRTMKEYGLPEPIFQNRRNEFVVILRNSTFAKSIELESGDMIVSRDGRQNALLEFCRTPHSAGNYRLPGTQDRVSRIQGLHRSPGGVQPAVYDHSGTSKEPEPTILYPPVDS